MNIIKTLKSGQQRIKKQIDSLLEKASLHVVFLIGIGLTSVLARLLLKQFVTKKYYFSSWKKRADSQTDNKMY